MSMTAEELARRYEEGTSYAALAAEVGKSKGAVYRRIQRYRRRQPAEPCAAKKAPPSTGTPSADPSGGISLAGVRTATQRPAGSETKARIYGLPKGKAFPLATLSAQWAVSEDTIRSHAKKYDAFRYVEATPGRWVACVLHPDTATS